MSTSCPRQSELTYVLELWLGINRACVCERLRHGFFTKLLRPDIVLEGLVRGVVRDHLVLEHKSVNEYWILMMLTYDDVPGVQLAPEVIHDLRDMILEGSVEFRRSQRSIDPRRKLAPP